MSYYYEICALMPNRFDPQWRCHGELGDGSNAQFSQWVTRAICLQSEIEVIPRRDNSRFCTRCACTYHTSYTGTKRGILGCQNGLVCTKFDLERQHPQTHPAPTLKPLASIIIIFGTIIKKPSQTSKCWSDWYFDLPTRYWIRTNINHR